MVIWNAKNFLNSSVPVFAQAVPASGGKQKLFDLNVLILDPLRKIVSGMFQVIPDLINAMYILLVGWVMAHIVQWIISKILKCIRFDKIAEKTGIEGALKDAHVSLSPSVWLSKLFYWLVILGAVFAALDELRMGFPVFRVSQIADFVFAVIGILVVFLVGLFLSVVVTRIARATALSLKAEKPEAYAQTIKWFVLIFTTLLILRQLAIPIEFVLTVAGAIFVTLCLTFILAFGIGGAEWANKVLHKLIK